MHTINRSSKDASDEGLFQYFQEVAQLPLVSSKEAFHLLELIEAQPNTTHTEAARNRLIEGHIHLVTPIARSYQGYGLDLADLIQEGNLVLTRIVRCVPPHLYHTFSQFAQRTISQALYERAKRAPDEWTSVEANQTIIFPPYTQEHTVPLTNKETRTCIFPEKRFLSLECIREEEDGEGEKAFS